MLIRPSLSGFKRKFSFSSISIVLGCFLGVFLLVQCGMSIFNLANPIDEESGKTGKISVWKKIAIDYYEVKDIEHFEKAQKILRNLIDYRWDEMSTEEKFNIVRWYSAVVFNWNVRNSPQTDEDINGRAYYEYFFDQLEILSENRPSEFFIEKLNKVFIDNSIHLSIDFREKARPFIKDLMPYADELESISVRDTVSLFFYLTTSAIISYIHTLDVIVPIDYSLNDEDRKISSSRTNFNNFISAYNVFSESNKAARADHNLTNELCDGGVDEVTYWENEFTSERVDQWNRYLDEVASLDLELISFLNQNKEETTYQKVFSEVKVFNNIDQFQTVIRQDIEDHIIKRNQFRETKTRCKSGQNLFD